MHYTDVLKFNATLDAKVQAALAHPEGSLERRNAMRDAADWAEAEASRLKAGGAA